MRTLWLLYELGLPFELIEMPFDLSALRSQRYLSIHPLGRVPCIETHEFKLFESGAITQYLCELVSEHRLGRTVGDPERYEWLQWIHYSETVAVHAAALVQQYHFIAESQRSAAVLDLERRRLKKSLEVVDAHLSNRDYLLEGGFSAADVSVGYSIYLADRFVPLQRLSNLARYYDVLRRRPAFSATLPRNWERPLTWLKGRVDGIG